MATEGQTNLDFNEARDDGLVVASAGTYSNHLHLAPVRQLCQHLVTQLSTGQMLFLMLNQQCENIEGNKYSNRK